MGFNSGFKGLRNEEIVTEMFIVQETYFVEQSRAEGTREKDGKNKISDD